MFIALFTIANTGCTLHVHSRNRTSLFQIFYKILLELLRRVGLLTLAKRHPWYKLSQVTGTQHAISCIVRDQEPLRNCLRESLTLAFKISFYREPSYPVGGNENWCSPMETSVEVLSKTKNRAVVWPSSFTPGRLSRENHMHACVHSSTIHHSQDMETTWVSSDRRMDEEDVAHVYME